MESDLKTDINFEPNINQKGGSNIFSMNTETINDYIKDIKHAIKTSESIQSEQKNKLNLPTKKIRHQDTTSPFKLKNSLQENKTYKNIDQYGGYNENIVIENNSDNYNNDSISNLIDDMSFGGSKQSISITQNFPLNNSNYNTTLTDLGSLMSSTTQSTIKSVEKSLENYDESLSFIDLDSSNVTSDTPHKIKIKTNKRRVTRVIKKKNNRFE